MKNSYDVIHVDVHGLAMGLYNLIIENGYKGILSIGMLPHDIMMSFEKNLDDKFPSTDLLIGDVYVEEKEIIQRKHDIVHSVTCEIYKIASEKGVMIV